MCKSLYITKEYSVMEETKTIDWTHIVSWYIPEKVTVTCFKGHDITFQNCFVCGKKLVDTDRRDLLDVGCGDENHHICVDCYGNLGQVVD